MSNIITDIYSGNIKTTGFLKHYLTLYAIIDGLEAKKTFEFGTGISTRVILEALQRTGGQHTSCDVRDLIDTGISPSLFVEQGDNWRFLQKNSNTIMTGELETYGPFDFVLHDGSHIPGEVQKDLKKIVPFMKQNSILLVHDTNNDKYGEGMLVAVKKALQDIEHEIVTLPFSYGLTIVKILGNKALGTVTPTWKK